MKKWFILCILFIGLTSEWVNAKDYANNNKKYTLLRQLNKLEQNDTTRLELYFKIAKLEKIEFSSYYSSKLLSEAQRLNNGKYQCKAYLCKMVDAYNQYDVKEVNRLMKLMEPIALKEKLYDQWFSGRRCVIDMLIVNGEYERQLKEAQEMLQYAEKLDNKIGIILAYQSLAVGHRMTYRTEKAIEISEKAYYIAQKVDTGLAIEINNSLVASYQSLDDYKNWFKWLKIMDKTLQKQFKTDPDNYWGWQMMVAISYISYYTAIMDFQQAANYIQQAEQYNLDNYSTYSFYYHQARYNYFSNAKLYEQALEETEILTGIYKELSPSAYSALMFPKAEILKTLGRYDEALDTYKQAFRIADSVNIAILNTQTEQLKQDYNTERVQLEQAKINRNIQFSYLILIVLLTALFIVFAVHAIKIRKGLHRSEREMRKMTEEMEQANVAKENFLATISTAINIPLTSVVKGSLQLATDEVTDKEERKIISETITATSAELMKLINNILELSKLEAKMMKFKIEEVEVVPFIQGVITMAISNGEKIQSHIPTEQMDLKIRVDIGRIGDAFRRLLLVAPNRTMDVVMKVDAPRKQLLFTVTNSQLASYKEVTRDIAMGNEINRLTMENFQGHYEQDANACVVRITLPLA